MNVVITHPVAGFTGNVIVQDGALVLGFTNGTATVDIDPSFFRVLSDARMTITPGGADPAPPYDANLDAAMTAVGTNGTSQFSVAQRAAFAPANVGISLAAFGLTGSTTDIKPLLDAAVAAGWKRIVIPYSATPWPLATMWTGNGVELYFEPGARISATMATGYAMDLTGCRLTNFSLTSPFAGPITTANQASYDNDGRALAVRSNCTIENFYAENTSWAPVDIQDNSSNIRIRGYTVTNVHHYKGWGAGLHAEGAGIKDVRVDGVHITNCDRLVELEAGVSDTWVDNGYAQDIYPPGFTGQPVDYAPYTFGLSVHSHVGEGACKGNRYRNWHLKDCAAGIEAIRSDGTNASDMPVGNTFENITLEGKRQLGDGSGQYNHVYLQGTNNHARGVRMLPGAGITSKFNCYIADGSTGCSVEVDEVTAMALPFMKISTSTCPSNRFKLKAANVTPMNTADWLVYSNSPDTRIELDVDTVTGSLGYVCLDTAAHYSSIDARYWKTSASETFTQVFRVKGAKNVRISGDGVAATNAPTDVFVTTSATGTSIDDFQVDRSAGASITLDATTSGVTVGPNVNTGGGSISNSAGSANRVLGGINRVDASVTGSTAKVYVGSGAPAISAPLGSLYIRTDTPGTASQRLYSCTTANTATTGAWTALV